jgi:hypothetical protein
VNEQKVVKVPVIRKRVKVLKKKKRRRRKVPKPLSSEESDASPPENPE